MIPHKKSTPKKDDYERVYRAERERARTLHRNPALNRPSELEELSQFHRRGFAGDNPNLIAYQEPAHRIAFGQAMGMYRDPPPPQRPDFTPAPFAPLENRDPDLLDPYPWIRNRYNPNSPIPITAPEPEINYFNSHGSKMDSEPQMTVVNTDDPAGTQEPTIEGEGNLEGWYEQPITQAEYDRHQAIPVFPAEPAENYRQIIPFAPTEDLRSPVPDQTSFGVTNLQEALRDDFMTETYDIDATFRRPQQVYSISSSSTERSSGYKPIKKLQKKITDEKFSSVSTLRHGYHWALPPSPHSGDSLPRSPHSGDSSLFGSASNKSSSVSTQGSGYSSSYESIASSSTRSYKSSESSYSSPSIMQPRALSPVFRRPPSPIFHRPVSPTQSLNHQVSDDSEPEVLPEIITRRHHEPREPSLHSKQKKRKRRKSSEIPEEERARNAEKNSRKKVVSFTRTFQRD